MKDLVLGFILVTITFAMFIWLGFFFGRRYEQQFWTKYYTVEMEKVCLECAGYDDRPFNNTKVPK